VDENNNKNSSEQLDAVKRQFGDLIAELRARNLLLPAAALLVAIVAAMVVLPKSSDTPVPPLTATAPVSKLPKIEPVAQISLVEPGDVGSGEPLSASENPFVGETGYVCQTVSKGPPKVLNCEVGGLKVRVSCPPDASDPPCVPAKSGGTGEAGAAGGPTSATTAPGGPTGIPQLPELPVGGGGGGGDNGSDTGGDTKGTSYVVTVSLDGKTTKDVVAGDELPKGSAPLVVYAGTNDSHNKAGFVASDGVVVSGVPTDTNFGSFLLKKGQSATLTDAKGIAHKLTLKSISKVSK
jgi:hypothetical protein